MLQHSDSIRFPQTYLNLIIIEDKLRLQLINSHDKYMSCLGVYTRGKIPFLRGDTLLFLSINIPYLLSLKSLIFFDVKILLKKKKLMTRFFWMLCELDVNLFENVFLLL